MAFRHTLARLAPPKLDKWLLRQYRDPEVRKHLGLKTAYRGRGAYTLLQLNHNYERFLDKKHITAVIDLGAHPGTWSQVVAGKLGWCPEPPKAPYLENRARRRRRGRRGRRRKVCPGASQFQHSFLR
ncbi:unnamed protein product [Cyclocybe aegerita]|uniref:Ribosomal RNA methyltransferase FtsJ domain-containing protein n=1 Tax=Cyclocybe aegerita TaxID=1973307 RepID=A0A8S0WBA0_CYCAE|nr:unnamed protein product [Cyclocybe aegerita]